MKVVDLNISQIVVEGRQERRLGDLDGLIASINDVGLLHPIVVGTDGMLKVGYRRLTAYKQMGRNTIPAHITDDLNEVYAALRAERDENVQREDLPPSIMVDRARELHEAETEAARERQGTRTDLEHCGNLPQSEQGKTRDKVAEAFGISGKTYEKAKQVVEAAEQEPEVFGDLPEMMDEKSVDRAYKEKRRREKKAKRQQPEPEVEAGSSYLVERGQVWKCGRHTVICGDCLAWLASIEADALITDPPYGIDYKPDWNKSDGSPSDFTSITGDDQAFDPSPFLNNYPTVLLFGANYFSNRLPLGGWLCWDKRTKEKLDAMFGSSFELAWYRSQHTARKAIMIRIQHGGVINADSEKSNNERRYHATQKPIALMREIVELLTEKSETVLDPFAGSGSTLLACERRGNVCISIEIEPENVAIILTRYEKETGGKPCLESRA